MVDVKSLRLSINANYHQEFEQLIDQHGAEQVTSLMQKVISALEHLEILVQNNETELQMIEDLRKTIEHLEHEETKKADERLKYARDIEQVEEHYKVRIYYLFASESGCWLSELD